MSGFTGGSNAGLRAGLYGCRFACAGELMKTSYPGGSLPKHPDVLNLPGKYFAEDQMARDGRYIWLPIDVVAVSVCEFDRRIHGI